MNKKPKKKEPALVRIDVNVPDDKGNERWYQYDLAMTDTLVEAIRKEVTIPEKAIDYNAMRLDAYEDYVSAFATYSSGMKLNHRQKGEFLLRDVWVPHPSDTIALKARLAEIDKMEKGDKS